MGVNKGHGIKGPRHDDDVDDLGINPADSAQQQGNLQSGAPQGNRQSGQQQGSQQSGTQQQQGGRQGESAGDASQAWDTDNSIDRQRGNR